MLIYVSVGLVDLVCVTGAVVVDVVGVDLVAHDVIVDDVDGALMRLLMLVTRMLR